MPIVCGVGLSYSPVIYRERSEWAELSRYLVGDVVQPNSRQDEDEAMLDSYADRIATAIGDVSQVLIDNRLDALVVLYADRGDVFDDSNTPQLHLQVGGVVWGETAFQQLGEESDLKHFACDEASAELLIEELVRSGFDVSEGRAAFTPLGKAGCGIGRAVALALSRLEIHVPIIPIQVNCHVEPTLNGARLHSFGRALAQAAELTDRRLGILVTGGLSGDPGGPMAGWVDDVLDEWVLSRLIRRQSQEIAQIWGARSRTLVGSSAEIRLWTIAGAAFELTECRARVSDYMALNHGAAGIAFVAWEKSECQ